MNEARELPQVLAELEAMPGFLGEAAAALDSEAARQPGPDGGLSFVEQVWHLADLEREGYGERIVRLRQEQAPHLPDFDGARLAREREYRRRSVAEGLAAFAAARQANLATLRGLSGADWDRAGSQEGVGPVRLRDIPALMAEHDAGHRIEIKGLLGR